MKKILSLLALLIVVLTTNAQNPFFQVVNYRGAFAPAPASPWTEGWTNWNPQRVVYPAITDTVRGNITANTTWTSNKTYCISGLVYVKGATLTIQPGTIIRGDSSIKNSSLIITKGAKINAVGTSTNPIVFTSSKDTGSRQVGDWGGIIILGKSTLNLAGGKANIEGIATSTDTEYGGATSPDDNDNSGNLKYVRIEYGGYQFETDKEINGLTLGAVGRNTTIDYVQCSYINDDAFEWFGGTVNCAHLVAYKCVDDNFDTDNGFSGSVQFCLGVRDPNLSDQSASSTSEGFESDNDANSSNNAPKTSCVFSNVTDISGFLGTRNSSYGTSFKFRRGARLRRNSEIKVLNSIFMDAPYGVMIDGAPCRANLQTGKTVFKNNIVAGNLLAVDPATAGYATVKDSLFTASMFSNDSSVSTRGILANPYDTLLNFNPDFRPASGSLARSNVNFTDAAFNNRKIVVTSSSFVKEVTYRGAFAPSPSAMWTDGWANWDPKRTVYPNATDTIRGTITTNTTWTANKTYCLSGLVYVAAGVTLTIQPGTIVRGDTSVGNSNSALIITRNAKLNAIGTADSAIVFTSGKDTATRGLGDWGGIILLGRASYNGPGGVANIEGIANSTNTEFGGGATPNDDDNSGTLKYVRIEFGGYVFDTDKEINGLTMGAVGRGTTIDYVQCSFVNDDAFEWFGGTVNCAHLVAYRCLDDNFDTDNGFSGSVQFGLGVRDPLISDQSASSTSEGFESDNDAAGSSNLPQTSALFTNITDISAYRGGTKVFPFPTTFKFRRSARIRRNSALKVFNSIFMDAPYGVFIDGNPCRANLQNGKTKFKNNLIAGSLLATEIGTLNSVRDSLFGSGTGLFKNDSLTTTTGVLVTPYDYTSPDYRPVLSGLGNLNASFTDTAFTGLIAPCDAVNAPGSMSGASNISGCSNPQTYSIPAISNASSYFWSVPSGATIVTGQGTRTITVNFTSTLAATWTGTISVVGKNDCGNNSVASTLNLRKVTLGVPGTIAVPTAFATSVCTLVGKDTSITYSVTAVAGATNYAWTKPANTTIISGQGTNSITLKFSSGYTTATAGDTLRLVVTSSCSTAVVQKLAIKAVLPAVPASITATVVSGLTCQSRIIRYSAPALVAPATGYQWQMPSGSSLATTALLDSGVLSGPNARYITVKFTSDAAAGANDSIKVAFTSACGNTAFTRLKLAITALSAPAVPASITATAVAPTTCGARVYRYAAPAIPTSTTAPAITGYEWSLPTGSSLAASAILDSGDLSGASARVIKVKFENDAAAGANDSIRVRYTYACGTSANKALKLAITALAAPAAPAAITATAVAPTACGARVYRYAAPAIPTSATAPAVTGYEWSLPTGSSLAASATLDSGVLSGASARFITVKFASDAAAGANDSIRVRYTYACGTTANKALKLAIVALGAPAVPASITATAVATNVCGERVYRYAAPAIPTSTTAPAVTGYEWSLPTGSSLAASATLDSGDLSGASARFIKVKFASDAAAGANDSIRVRYTYACGTTANKALKLAITALAAPAAPTAITATVVNSTACGARVYRYAAPAIPTTIPAITGYEWSLPTGSSLAASATLDSGELSGEVARYIKVKFTSNAAAGANDSIRVRYTYACGTSANKAAKLAITALNCAGNVPAITKAVNNNVSTEKTMLYPNPNNGIFTLNVTTGKFENAKATIQIVDVMGKMVYQTNAVVNNGILNSRINNYNLSNGIYTVRYTIGSVTNTVKMVVQK